MQIYHGLGELPADLGATAVTIGNFDGVHLGHQHVLQQLVEHAHRTGSTAVVITFDPHPALVHRPESAPELLTGTAEKLARIEATGVDAVLVVDYTPEFYVLTPEEFTRTWLVQGLGARAVVVGHDLRFGRENSGDFSTMVQLGEQHGFEVVGVADYEISGITGARCSSTAIRTALQHGDVDAVLHMLGRPHAVMGEVVHGAARGRELGFPTANLSAESEGMIPADGVYAGYLVDAHGRRWPAAISVGSNPTFDGVERVVESHVIDRPHEQVEDFDLYGQYVRVEFLSHLRGMIAYEGVEKLVAQMQQDVDETRRILAASEQA
ncbi:bifunctional riboflavin kinase/FAD synthetase [Nesterenkonia flava]